MYSQHNEEQAIKSYFPPGYVGACVEVGALDGIRMSNTYQLELDGWRCLCVEPNPTSFLSLQKNRKACKNFAVGSVDADGVDFTCVVTKNTDESGISSLTVDERLVKTHSHLINKQYVIKVQVRRLDTILAESGFGIVDFLSIDTEGTELDVLRGFDIARYSPRLMLIENNFNDGYIEEYLSKFGYRKDRRLTVNDFYVRSAT